MAQELLDEADDDFAFAFWRARRTSTSTIVEREARPAVITTGLDLRTSILKGCVYNRYYICTEYFDILVLLTR